MTAFLMTAFLWVGVSSALVLVCVYFAMLSMGAFPNPRAHAAGAIYAGLIGAWALWLLAKVAA